MNTALVLIDLQNDYFPGGAMELAGSTQAVTMAATLLQAYRAAQWPIVHIQHIADRPDATFFLPHTYGATIHHSVSPYAEEKVFIKHFPSAFRGTSLQAFLAEKTITHLVVAGMMTHMCVSSTVRAAFDLGFSCTLAHDACATKNLTLGARTIEADTVHVAHLAALQGLFADVRSTQDICEHYV